MGKIPKKYGIIRGKFKSLSREYYMKHIYLLALAINLNLNFALADEFNPGIAVGAAATIADSNKSAFVTSFIPANAKVESTVPVLTKALLNAAKTKNNLAIIGPNYKINALILNTALQNLPDQSLDGATILYVVDSNEDTTSLGITALMKGAILRSTVYPH